MNEKHFIIVCALISFSFLMILDNAFIVSTEPPKHLIDFTVNNKKITVGFNCDPQYFRDNTTLICTDGEIIRP